MTDRPTIASLAAELATGRTTSVALTEAALARISEPKGEGKRAFLRVDAEAALAQAAASDGLRAHGIVPSPLAGLPVSVKDLLNVAGQPTAAGSVALADAEPAAADAPVVARLRAAGAVIIGRTNMTEFAFSGLGLNPHFGTPGNPFDRERIPGGSSSGAAVSVADGMAAAAVGSDTGGSVRIPAAFCGLVGLKPTQPRVPRDGVLPLSWSLDTIGPLARSVACCAVMDAIMAGEPAAVPEAVPVTGLRLMVPRGYLLDGLDATVAAAFTRALHRLSSAGARIAEERLAAVERVPAANGRGGLAAPEAYAWHRDLLERRGETYDPRVRARLVPGAAVSAADYIETQRAREALIAEADAATQGIDALVLPTVAVVAPRLDELAADQAYARINALVLRNTAAFNFLDRPAASVPCASDGMPVGLMLVGARFGDRRLLAVARAVESLVA